MGNRVLRGWKEIAAFVRTSERSAQRWTTELGLPVKKQGDSRRAPVFAYEQELQAWMATVARQKSAGQADLARSLEAYTGDQEAPGTAASPARKKVWRAGLLVLSIVLAIWALASGVALLHGTPPNPHVVSLRKLVTLRFQSPGSSEATLTAYDGDSTSITLQGKQPFQVTCKLSGRRLLLEVSQSGPNASLKAPYSVEIEPGTTVRLKQPYPVELTWVSPFPAMLP